MGRSKIDEKCYAEIAEKTGADIADVRRAVSSFFSVISSDAASMHLSKDNRIYSREAFDSLADGKVVNIPYIGRIGPSYSRYLAWKKNATKGRKTVPRSSYRKGYTKEDYERMAEAILNGKEIPSKRRNSFKRIWLIGADGKKRQARQVIPIDETENDK